EKKLGCIWPNNLSCGRVERNHCGVGGPASHFSKGARRRASPTSKATAADRSVRSTLERVDPGNACPNDQRVDVMRALVGFDAFEVHQVPHDGVIVGDAVGA